MLKAVVNKKETKLFYNVNRSRRSTIVSNFFFAKVGRLRGEMSDETKNEQKFYGKELF